MCLLYASNGCVQKHSAVIIYIFVQAFFAIIIIIDNIYYSMAGSGRPLSHDTITTMLVGSWHMLICK